MTYKNAKVVVMLAALAVGLGATEAFAEIEPPMVQHAHGVPLEQVQCRDSKILMEMTGGTPACVSKETAKKLEQRGLGRIVVSNSNAYVLPEKYSYSGIGESKAHGIEKHYPVLSTVEFPGSISVGQTVSIPYTVSWYHPNGTATHSELGTYGTDNILTHIRIFVPEEFTVLNEDKVFLLRLGDFYAPHSGTTYWIGVRCSEDTVSGSIDLRLDRHMYHDRDLFWYASDAGVYNFQLQQTDEGVNLVPVSDLISEYDIDAHLATVVWASEGIVVNGTWFPIDDDLLRYDRYYSKDVEHVPETKPVTQTARSEPEVDVYMEERTWPGLAEFLRYIVENGESVSDYVYTPKFSQKFIDDFGMAYPEFGLQDHARASGSTSSAPTSFFISGNYYVDKGRIFDVAINDARICVYDKNLATGTQQICMWSRPPAI